MNTQELWNATLGELELKLSKAHFTTWFRNTFIADFTEKEIIIGVPNTFTKAWLEKKYHKDILDSLCSITKQTIRNLNYRVDTQTNTPIPIVFNKTKEENKKTDDRNYGFTTYEEPAKPKTVINQNYTFSSFIVGKQNELAHAAAQAVAAQLGGTYNPLFIYGGVGLGKTHLLHSMGNEVLARDPNKKVMYVTCEHFTNDFIQAIRSGKAKDFKDRYRSVDLLLIDDIQFITGKEGTQEEFFHTFNELHQENKQIVICSDRAPKAIAALEKRLLSRLEWGMLVDIGAPDLETRIAILDLKCQRKGVELSREILNIIASNIVSNVRELEGALNKIIAYHQFKNIDPSIETIKPLLETFEANSIKKTISTRQIITTVSEYFDLNIPDLLGKSREKRLAFPRQIIMFLLREEMKCSYPSIGAELGGRDHTTAMHAYSKILKQLKEDEMLSRDLEIIKQKLYST